MKKIVRINNIITPTGISYFNILNKYLSSQGYELLVLFLSASESNRTWNLNINDVQFHFKVLNSKQLEIKGLGNYSFYMHYDTGINKALNEENPDIVIHDGWASFSAWQSQKWCKKHKKKFIIKNESTKFEKSRRRSITKPMVKSIVKKSDGYISCSTRSKEYLEILGANPHKICEYYDTVDNDFFINESNRLKDKKQFLKDKYGINTKYCALFVGQMVKLKGIYEIIEGFNIFSKNHNDWSLLMVGDGKERKKIEYLIQKLGIKNVILPGFIQKDKIGELYTIADVSTLPSFSEVWGYVINEAMCFGLSIITTKEVGASEDLVIEGKTGYIMKNHSPQERCNGLNYIIEKNLFNKNDSLTHIQNFRYDKFIPNIKMFLDEY